MNDLRRLRKSQEPDRQLHSSFTSQSPYIPDHRDPVYEKKNGTQAPFDRANCPVFRSANPQNQRLPRRNHPIHLDPVYSHNTATNSPPRRFHGLPDPRCWRAICLLCYRGELRTLPPLSDESIQCNGTKANTQPNKQPFNAFLSGFCAALGQFVLTASLRMQMSGSSAENKGASSTSKGKKTARFEGDEKTKEKYSDER